jgi:hypothetical protein
MGKPAKKRKPRRWDCVWASGDKNLFRITQFLLAQTLNVFILMSLDFGAADYHWMFREIITRLDRMHSLVDRGLFLDTSEYVCVLLVQSGIVRILKANSIDGPLRCDGYLVESEVREILRLIHRKRAGD